MFVRKWANTVFANIVESFLKEYSYLIFSQNIYEPFIMLWYTNLKEYLLENKVLEIQEQTYSITWEDLKCQWGMPWAC